MASASRNWPGDQGFKVKFLINIPLKVDSVDQAQRRCGYLLDEIIKGLREQDRTYEFVNDRKVLQDVAVIFGMNGKHTPELVQILQELATFRYSCKVNFAIITYTWGSGGTIAQEATDTPFQDIREHLKNSPATRNLVEALRGNDPRSLIYFSFVDSDTIEFNFIYSEYIQIVREEWEKDKIPPTVMSTGYEFLPGDKRHIASWLDRTVRTAVAEVYPLFVYYPEPNFCVLVRDTLNTIEESFIDRRRGNIMESPVLISRVKTRANFKAVFSDRNPIIIDAPKRFGLSGKGLVTGQSTLSGMTLAQGANCNKVLTHKHTMRGIAGKDRGFIIRLFNCKSDREFNEMSKENPYNMNGEEATMLVNAIKEARECKNFIYEFEKKLPKD
ncbi:hypothetical protein ROHU_016250 [Labeo rohita]|uniref:Uncharacterized protein n=1 Tax=Labeo rohita TaxID=84645 RepID=A0A498NK90_LABRO|nr:hypothetical protein ROHU_016250 [Labeo rohita]